MAVIGIDLGTTYSAAATFIDGETHIILLDGDSTLPSVVGVRPNGKIAVGRVAKRNQARNPQDTIIEIKRKMGMEDEKTGQPVKVRLGQKELTPPEISAMILSTIKELAEDELGEEVEGVVISCPAYFKDPRRQATKEAGQIAGLNVLRIVNEPTAAAYAYGLVEEGEDKERLAMVYDLGGGTFDVTIVKMLGGNLEVIGTSGDPELGGGNFDDRVVDWMLDLIKKENPGYSATLTDDRLAVLKLRLKAYAEDAKKALCGPPARESYQFQIAQVDTFDGKPVSFSEILTMEKFDDLIRDLMENSVQWLDEAMKVPREKYNYTDEHITDILLVGGSTRVPLVRKMLEDRYPKEKYPNIELRGVESGINPDEIVARGASIVAAQADPFSDEIVETSLVDVTGHALSVAVAIPDPESPHGFREVLEPLIPKETPIPTSSEHIFSSQGQGQPRCQIKVYQGEGREIDPEKVTMVGEFMIEIEPIPEPTPLKVGLDLDQNGLLVAHATDMRSGRQVKCEMNYEDSTQLSPEQVKQKQAQLKSVMQGTVGRSANPLDDTAQPASSGTKPQAASQPAQPTSSATAASGDPAAGMNPIMRALYQKAIDNYARIPPDRQPQVMQLVSDIDAAAKAGDQNKVMTYYGPLMMLLQGID